MIQRAFPTFFVDDLAAMRDFYVGFFGWTISFDSDWFVHLQAVVDDNIELGLMKRDHELVPAPFRPDPSQGESRGMMITIVVDDVDALHAKAQAEGVAVVEPPRDLFYGQRRMVLRDPSGGMVDVSSECAPSEEFMASLGA